MARKSAAFNANEFLLELSERLGEASRAPNIKKYSPHEKQYVFHSSRKKKKLYIGGNRSGKTTGGVTEAIWRATCTHPYRDDLNALGPTRGRVIAVDFVNGVEKIIFPQYKQWLYPSALYGGSWETAYDKYLRTLTFSNGSTIEFMSYDQDLDKFAGTSRHWVHFDEEPPKPIYNENMARLIDTAGDFWITMTPVEGMTWIHEDLYEKNVDNPNGSVLVIEINTLENPYLKAEAIEDFLDGVDEDEVTTRIQGQFVQKGGRIYKNFNPTIGKLHVLADPILDPKHDFRDWLWICSLDHGLNNPTAVLWTAIDPNGFAILFDEHYKREWTVDLHAEEIKRRIKRHGRAPDLFIADPSIKARNGASGTSIHEEYIKYGIAWVPGNNDVKSGIIRVKKYLNQHKYVGNSLSPFFADEVRPKDDAMYRTFPMLRIAPNCVNIINEMKKYRWKTYRDKKLQYENNPYDEPHKKDDHAADSLRYALMSQPDLFASKEQAHPEGSFREQVDTALSNLGVGSDSMFQFAHAGSGQEVNDPRGLLEGAGGWQQGNDIPPLDNTGWDYDEHLGGIA